MVAQTIFLPNVRKFFIPDEGMVMVEGDLERADAQVFAWEADDEIGKDIFRRGLDIHNANARSIYSVPNSIPDSYFKTDLKGKWMRDKAKRGVHGTNFVGGDLTMSETLECSIAEYRAWKLAYFTSRPAVPAFHARIDKELAWKREVKNIWGYRRYFFERPSECLPEAIAWICSSTVSTVIDKALVALEEYLAPEGLQLLMQVHDSLLMQVPKEKLRSLISKIHRLMHITIPFKDPLVIPVSLGFSEKSWGHCKDEGNKKLIQEWIKEDA